MPNWLPFTRAHCAIYRATRGLIGANLLGIQMLLLTTRGRKTGLRRVLPLAFVEYKGDFVVVASNGGSESAPAWWLNLRDAATAEVQVRGETFEVSWSEAPEKERMEYWRKLQAAVPAYRMYRFRTQREIPIVLLRPLADSAVRATTSPGPIPMATAAKSSASGGLSVGMSDGLRGRLNRVR